MGYLWGRNEGCGQKGKKASDVAAPSAHKSDVEEGIPERRPQS